MEARELVKTDITENLFEPYYMLLIYNYFKEKKGISVDELFADSSSKLDQQEQHLNEAKKIHAKIIEIENRYLNSNRCTKYNLLNEIFLSLVDDYQNIAIQQKIEDIEFLVDLCPLFLSTEDIITANTLLHKAAEKGEIKIVECLLNLKMDPMDRNLEGKRPIDLATDEKVKELLAQAMPKDSSVQENEKHKPSLEESDYNMILNKMSTISTFTEANEYLKKIISSYSLTSQQIENLEAQCWHYQDFPELFKVLEYRVKDIEVFKKYILQNKLDINARLFSDVTPLYRAVQGGEIHLQVIKSLHEMGAKVFEVECWDGASPLFMAVQEGHFKILDYFLTLPNAKIYINRPNTRGQTALETAVNKGNISIIQKLIVAGADVNAEGIMGNALWTAMSCQQLIAAKILLKNGANVHARSREDNLTILEKLAEIRENKFTIDLCKAIFVLQKNVAFYIKNEKGITPFTLAVISRNFKIAKIFADKGADINIEYNGFTLLASALYYFDNQKIDFLLSLRGIKVNNSNVSYLALAAVSGNVEVMKVLISKGADVNQYCPKNPKIAIVLYNALVSNSIEAIKVLLNNNVNIDFAMQQNPSVFLTTIFTYCDLEIVKMLVEAEPNFVNFAFTQVNENIVLKVYLLKRPEILFYLLRVSSNANMSMELKQTVKNENTIQKVKIYTDKTNPNNEHVAVEEQEIAISNKDKQKNSEGTDITSIHDDSAIKINQQTISFEQLTTKSKSAPVVKRKHQTPNQKFFMDYVISLPKGTYLGKRIDAKNLPTLENNSLYHYLLIKSLLLEQINNPNKRKIVEGLLITNMKMKLAREVNSQGFKYLKAPYKTGAIKIKEEIFKGEIRYEYKLKGKNAKDKIRFFILLLRADNPSLYTKPLLVFLLADVAGILHKGCVVPENKIKEISEEEVAIAIQENNPTGKFFKNYNFTGKTSEQRISTLSMS